MSREEDAVLLLLSRWRGVVCTEVSTCPCWKLIGGGSCRVLCFGALVILICKMCSAKRLGAYLFPKPLYWKSAAKADKQQSSCRVGGSVWSWRWQQDKGGWDGCIVWPLLFVQTDVLTGCVQLDYSMALLDHVSWASTCLNVLFHLSSHSLPVLLRCDCLVSVRPPGNSCFR